MEKLTAIIEVLNEAAPDWYRLVSSKENFDSCNDETVKEHIVGLLEELKILLKKETNVQQLETELKKLIPQEDIVKTLIGRVRETLQIFFLLQPLRDIEKKERDLVSLYLEQLFRCCLVRQDLSFWDKYAFFGFSSEEEMVNVSSGIEVLVDYYMVSRLASENIYLDFQDETELTGKNCRYFTQLLEENYHALTLNYILEHLSVLA